MVRAPLFDRTGLDQRVLIHGMSWQSFETMLTARGDTPLPRMAFAHHTVELLSPSRRHEQRTSLVARLIEVNCQERGIHFSPWGSTLLTDAGAEPRESYAFAKGLDPTW